MNTFRKILIVLFVSITQIIQAQTLDVHIDNIKNMKGQLCIAIFTSEAGFTAEEPYRTTNCKKELVTKGDIILKIPIKPGRYGLSVLDDENENGKMEYRMFGIPSEGFGFSNYYQKGIRKPAFDDFSFVVEKNEVKTITVIMKYF